MLQYAFIPCKVERLARSQTPIVEFETCDRSRVFLEVWDGQVKIEHNKLTRRPKWNPIYHGGAIPEQPALLVCQKVRRVDQYRLAVKVYTASRRTPTIECIVRFDQLIASTTPCYDLNGDRCGTTALTG